MAARRGVVREEHKATDYDEEARKLFRQLNLPPDGDASRGRSMYNNLDAIYRHPKSGGVVYVGNISAARSADILRKNNISRVVNCQDKSSENFHEGKPGFVYFRFSIARWFFSARQDAASILKFFQPVHKFIDDSIAGGHNVLIHCLAGAHRAGTTGISYLMHAADLERTKAITAAKRCRPIIDPISSLGELLVLYQSAREVRKEVKK